MELVKANSVQVAVNKLPNELLSNIFIIVDTAQRARRLKSELVHYQFPQLAAQVCSYWRKVAIDTPLLWTYIHIDRPPPHQLAALYLSRAGPHLLLEIELDLNTSYWEKIGINPTHWKRHTDYLPDLLAFLTASGAHICRWKSLIARVKTPRLAFEIIRVLNAESAPALEFFLCKWMIGAAPQFDSEETNSVRDLTRRYDNFEPFRLSSHCLPKLRSAELIEIPWGFAVDRPPSAPLFCGLVSLRLVAGFKTRGFKCFHGLFSANPQLEKLCISSESGSNDNNDDEVDVDVELEHYPCVSLPCLRQLELRTCKASDWVGPTLQMIDAPNLRHFALGMQHPFIHDLDNADIFSYLAAGRASVPNDPNVEPSIPKPIFPSLRYLDVNITSDPGVHRCNFERLLSVLPLVHHLIIPSYYIDVLGKEPWVLPNLSYLEIRHSVPRQLGDILRRRFAAGLSAVETVGLVVPGGDEVEGGLPDSVRVVGVPPSESEMEPYTDEDNSDHWDD